MPLKSREQLKREFAEFKALQERKKEREKERKKAKKKLQHKLKIKQRRTSRNGRYYEIRNLSATLTQALAVYNIKVINRIVSQIIDERREHYKNHWKNNFRNGVKLNKKENGE